MEPSGDDQLSPLLGTLLDDRYRLSSVIARGGMATVFLATDTRLDRQVAVKVMHRALADDPEFVARFTREAKASAKLSAAEVVAVHDYGTDRATGLAYLVMEHVRGMNLRQLIQERGALTPTRAVSLMEPVLRALAAAHAAGLVHRDIKPENVLLADDGRVKVADFGLARAVETSNLTQTTGLLIGTVAYLSPEQVESGSSDARSDVYSAGILLWELLTGAPPYSAESPLSVAYKHVHEDVPAPSTATSGIPPALDALVVKATRRDPAARPADGAAFLAELRDAGRAMPGIGVPSPVDHQTIAIQRPAQVVPPRSPADVRRRRGLIALIGLLVLALLALGGGYYLGSYRYTKAPGVLKLSLTAAEAKIQRAGLKPKHGGDEFSETVARGLVVRQDPGSDHRVRKGGEVTLFLSKGPDRRRIPADLVGKTRADAEKELRDAGLAVNGAPQLEYSSSVPKDRVTKTSPAPGTALKPGTLVTLFLSKGPEPVQVTDVRGRQKTEALGVLRAEGFVVVATDVFSDDQPIGVVITQDPSGGMADKGSTVTLTVSKGPDVVTIPDVHGEKIDDAKRELEALGLKVSVYRPFPGGPGKVQTMDPDPGKKVRRGTTVTLGVF
ncbi:MAG: spk1 [Frankiales bacterium]|nr:spk1 [Frankiales bacterium]